MHPYLLLLEAFGCKWRERAVKDYRPQMEQLAFSIIELFKERPISIILFRSLTKSSENKHSDSDIDSSVVADEIRPAMVEE